MTITTAEYKAAIEAKIAAATGATTLKDLTLIKTNADLWLLNNEGGSIDGYASLEALIQDEQDDLTGSSALNEISFVGVSAFPPQSGGGAATFKNKVQITTSQNWTVPDGVYRLEVWATGGGNSGTSVSAGSGDGGGGGGAASTYSSIISVTPGQVLNIVVGSGGIGVAGSGSAFGGQSSVIIAGMPIVTSSVTLGSGASNVGSKIIGGNSTPGTNSSAPGSSGEPAKLVTYSNSLASISSSPRSLGGTGGTARYAGSGGSSSAYGPGGNGANGSNSSGPGVAGDDAQSTSYGAGGGGASGYNIGIFAKGGNGADGIVEICY